MKPENNSDWRRLWENREALPSTSHRRILGPLLVGLKTLFKPLGDFLFSRRLDTQREFNLHLIRTLDALETRLSTAQAELTRSLAQTRESLQAQLHADLQNIQASFQEHFSELQREVLILNHP